MPCLLQLLFILLGFHVRYGANYSLSQTQLLPFMSSGGPVRSLILALLSGLLNLIVSMEIGVANWTYDSLLSFAESEKKESSSPCGDDSTHAHRVLKYNDGWWISVINAEPTNGLGDALKILSCLWYRHTFCSIWLGGWGSEAYWMHVESCFTSIYIENK